MRELRSVHVQQIIRGTAHIKAVYELTNGFEGFGFEQMSKVGQLYAAGLAQPREVPSSADIEKAVECLEEAIERFDSQSDDPNNRGYLQIASDQLELQRKRLVDDVDLLGSPGNVDAINYGADERRRKMMTLTNEAAERVSADKAAFARLSQRLAREGW